MSESNHIPRIRLKSTEEYELLLRFRGELENDGAPLPLTAEQKYKDEIFKLRRDLRDQARSNIMADEIRRLITGMAAEEYKPPRWISSNGVHGGQIIPTLFLSDFHWGEVVKPSQVMKVNEFSLSVAQERLHRVIDVATDLLFNHTAEPSYPGLVLALGGDMVTGDIHEELSVTNDAEIMPTVLDLADNLTSSIGMLLDHFDNIFIPCVTGNHGRNTKKIRHKGRAHTSFDWLTYQMLERNFAGDDRVTFYIPESADAHYKVFNHRYLLTHGDQFRGGDGMIGPFGPVLRGDHKKRSRNNEVGLEYDTMIIGHFHSLLMHERVIMNGSLKGYDEYAFSGNFPYEAAKQALWLTHSRLGITDMRPVLAQDLVRHKGRSNQTITWAD